MTKPFKIRPINNPKTMDTQPTPPACRHCEYKKSLYANSESLPRYCEKCRRALGAPYREMKSFCPYCSAGHQYIMRRCPLYDGKWYQKIMAVLNYHDTTRTGFNQITND